MQPQEDGEGEREEEGHHEEEGAQRGLQDQAQDPRDGVAVQHVLEGREAGLLRHYLW